MSFDWPDLHYGQSMPAVASHGSQGTVSVLGDLPAMLRGPDVDSMASQVNDVLGDAAGVGPRPPEAWLNDAAATTTLASHPQSEHLFPASNGGGICPSGPQPQTAPSNLLSQLLAAASMPGAFFAALSLLPAQPSVAELHHQQHIAEAAAAPAVGAPTSSETYPPDPGPSDSVPPLLEAGFTHSAAASIMQSRAADAFEPPVASISGRPAIEDQRAARQRRLERHRQQRASQRMPPAESAARSLVLPPVVRQGMAVSEDEVRAWRRECRRIAAWLAESTWTAQASAAVARLLLHLEGERAGDAPLARALPKRLLKLRLGSQRERFYITEGRPTNSRLDPSSPARSPAARYAAPGVYLVAHYTPRCMECRTPWRDHPKDTSHSRWQAKFFVLAYVAKPPAVLAKEKTYKLPATDGKKKTIELWVPHMPSFVAWHLEPRHSTTGGLAAGTETGGRVGEAATLGAEAVGDSGSEDFDPSGEEDEGVAGPVGSLAAEGQQAAGALDPSAAAGGPAVLDRAGGSMGTSLGSRGRGQGVLAAAAGAIADAGEAPGTTAPPGGPTAWPAGGLSDILRWGYAAGSEGAMATAELAGSHSQPPGAKHQREDAPREAEEHQEAARTKQPCVEAPWEDDRRAVLGFLEGCCEPQQYGSDDELLARWRALLGRVGVRYLLAMRLANGQCLAHWLATPPTHLDDSVQPPPPPPADPDAPLREEVAVGMVQAAIGVLGLRRWRQLLGVKDRLNGATPLHRGARYGLRVRVFELMLRYASRCSLTCFSNQGFMAYHNAFRCGHSQAGMAHLSAVLSLARELQEQQAARAGVGGGGSTPDPLDDGLCDGLAAAGLDSDDEADLAGQPLPLLIYSLSNKYFQGRDLEDKPVRGVAPTCGHDLLREACAELGLQLELSVLSKEPWSILHHGCKLGKLTAGWLRRLDSDAPRGQWEHA